MDIKNGLSLPILYNTDETSLLQDLDLKIDVNDLEVYPIIFYTINGICESKTYGSAYTNIYFNGDMLTSKLCLEQVQYLIKQALF